MSRLSELSILYGTPPVREPSLVEEYFTEKVGAPKEEATKDRDQEKADAQLAIRVRERGERAFFEGDEKLAVACRELWKRLT